jgi:DNA-binding HxlR family transcriptional regulator
MKNSTDIDNQKVKKEKKRVFDENNCPVTATMRVIGGKWKLIVINFIYSNSPARFGELKRKMKGITQTMLTTQLRELEADGIVHRKVYAEIPPRVEYTLTELGFSLRPLIGTLAELGKAHFMKRSK